MDADYEATGYPSEYSLWYNNWWKDVWGERSQGEEAVGDP